MFLENKEFKFCSLVFHSKFSISQVITHSLLQGNFFVGKLIDIITFHKSNIIFTLSIYTITIVSYFFKIHKFPIKDFKKSFLFKQYKNTQRNRLNFLFLVLLNYFQFFTYSNWAIEQYFGLYDTVLVLHYIKKLIINFSLHLK